MSTRGEGTTAPRKKLKRAVPLFTFGLYLTSFIILFYTKTNCDEKFKSQTYYKRIKIFFDLHPKENCPSYAYAYYTLFHLRMNRFCACRLSQQLLSGPPGNAYAFCDWTTVIVFHRRRWCGSRVYMKWLIRPSGSFSDGIEYSIGTTINWFFIFTLDK